MFNNTVEDEYVALATEADFTRSELARLARNGWEAAQVSGAARAATLAEIDRLLAAEEIEAG